LSKRQVTRAAVHEALEALKAMGPNAVAKQARVSAAALRVAHSVPSSSSSTLEIRVFNEEPSTTPGTCTIRKPPQNQQSNPVQSISQSKGHTWQGHKMTRGAKKCDKFPSDKILQQQIPTDKWLYLHSSTHCRNKWKLDRMLAIF
jgi:hypothetical protein